MRINNRITLIILITLLCISCGKLSRGKAESEITKNMQLPQTETATLNKKFKKEHMAVVFGKLCLDNLNWFKNYETQLLELQSQGYITLKDDESYDECDNLYTHVILTEKGRKDLVKEDDGNYHIRVYDVTFGEVTGIVEYKDFGKADVRYTLKRTGYSEFGKYVYKLSYPNRNQAETINRLANFTKYDDGWRMGN